MIINLNLMAKPHIVRKQAIVEPNAPCSLLALLLRGALLHEQNCTRAHSEPPGLRGCNYGGFAVLYHSFKVLQFSLSAGIQKGSWKVTSSILPKLIICNFLFPKVRTALQDDLCRFGGLHLA